MRYEDVSLEAVPDQPRAAVVAARIVVEGTYEMGSCHWWAARGARRQADTVTLWVRGRGGLAWLGSLGCKETALVSSFRATIGGLVPGSYVVRLKDGGPRQPEQTVGTVVVPPAG